MRRQLAALPALFAALVLVLTGCSLLAPRDDGAVAGSISLERATEALQVLEGLEVKGRAPLTGYDRKEFGRGWQDTDRNGCDTRNDVLARDLTDAVVEGGARGCKVLSGVLNDPYTGQTIYFQRGEGTSELVQIDHVVALADAWQSGAQSMSFEDRRLFANDPLNLLAVDGPQNQAKGAADAATWLPPAAGFRCEYVVRQIEVKGKYDLWVKPGEKRAMERVLAQCGAPVEVSGVVFVQSCAEAREKDLAPMYRGEPGYREELDGDGDGIACE